MGHYFENTFPLADRTRDVFFAAQQVSEQIMALPVIWPIHHDFLAKADVPFHSPGLCVWAKLRQFAREQGTGLRMTALIGEWRLSETIEDGKDGVVSAVIPKAELVSAFFGRQPVLFLFGFLRQIQGKSALDLIGKELR